MTPFQESEHASPNTRPGAPQYQAGLYDHLLKDSQKRVLIPEFADIQYAIRQALDDKTGEEEKESEKRVAEVGLQVECCTPAAAGQSDQKSGDLGRADAEVQTEEAAESNQGLYSVLL